MCVCGWMDLSRWEIRIGYPLSLELTAEYPSSKWQGQNSWEEEQELRELEVTYHGLEMGADPSKSSV